MSRLSSVPDECGTGGGRQPGRGAVFEDVGVGAGAEREHELLPVWRARAGTPIDGRLQEAPDGARAAPRRALRKLWILLAHPCGHSLGVGHFGAAEQQVPRSGGTPHGMGVVAQAVTRLGKRERQPVAGELDLVHALD